MSTLKSYAAAVIVTSTWSGTVTATCQTKAEETARSAFDDGAFQQSMQDVLHVDVRPAPKPFIVTYAIEQGFSVRVDAASGEDAELLIKQRLDDTCAVLDQSERVHFESTVIEAEEVAP
jgi:hypothetical protein